MRTAPARAIVLVSCLLLTACGGGGHTSGGGEPADAGRGTTISTVAGTATGPDAGDCTDEVSNDAAVADHVDPGTALTYDGVPPVSGTHWGQWPDLANRVFTADERPELGELVHSQEHGWTLVWYDEALADDAAAMAELESAIVAVTEAGGIKLAAVPWTADDGDALPDGARVALTHWAAAPNETEQRQFCADPSAEAIAGFLTRNPYTNSREPNAP